MHRTAQQDKTMSTLNPEGQRDNHSIRPTPESDVVSPLSVQQGKQKQVEAQVQAILETDEEARNNDTWLLLKYWKVINGVKVISFLGSINQLTPMESITRARRKIQSSMPQLQPTRIEVIRKRRIKQTALHMHYSH